MNAAAPETAIVITGMGAVSALGVGCAALWEGIAEGRDGVRPIERFATDGYTTRLAGLVPEFDQGPLPSTLGERNALDLCRTFAVLAAEEALAEARAQVARPAPERVALVLGTSIFDAEHEFHRLTADVADALAARGPRVTVTTACSSSTTAVGVGRDLLLSGAADLVLAGGADVVTPELFAGFHALGVLSPAKCAPFSEPPGTNLGEGAGLLVLERAADARRRGATALVELLGYGLSGDAYHETSPDPSGAGMARAIDGALRDAGVRPEEVGYVNAHGTGTEANDPAEWRALQLVFGERAVRLPISSTKSILGHAQGAAGALELITTVLAMRRGCYPPTLHFTGPRPNSPGDPVGESRPRPGEYRQAVSCNSACAGANAAVVVALPSGRTRERRRRAVRAAGVGAIGGFGVGAAALARALAAGAPAGPSVAPFRLDQLVRTADARGLDPSARFLTAAAALALADAGIRVRGPLRERVGLVVGASRLSAQSAGEFWQSIQNRGLRQVSTTAFARMVLNASAGSCARVLALRGPGTTLSTGRASGLVAIAQAAHLMAERDDADVILCGGFDEIGPGVADRAEGSAVVALATDAAAPAGSPRLSGWGLAGPGDLFGAIRQALEIAQLRPEDVGAVYCDRAPGEVARALGGAPRRTVDVSLALGCLEASGAALALGAAVLAARRPDEPAALVVSDGGTASCSLVLTTGG